MEYGLIGEKLGHSYSKIIQEKLLDNYTYDLHPIAKDDLDTFMKAKMFKSQSTAITATPDAIEYIQRCHRGIPFLA